MRSSVSKIWSTWVAKFEGRLPFMYLDAIGLVTTGVGNKIDPIASAIALPWIVPGRGPATTEEVTKDWNTVKAAQAMRLKGGVIFRPLTIVRLSDAEIDNLVGYELATFGADLVKYFPRFESWNAYGQLGALSMAWGMGAHFAPGYPRFTQAVNADPPDWGCASVECREFNGAPKRNAANQNLFLRARDVDANGGDPDDLSNA